MTDVFKDLPTANMAPSVYEPDRQHDAVAIVSGGMDSITLVHDMVMLQNLKPHVLSFNYGQRHKKELTYAGMVARRYGLKWDIVDLQTITHLISNSALTSQNECICDPNPETTDGPQRECPTHGDSHHRIEVPEGHYAEDNMAVTVVPNRNMIMLSIAAGVAVNYNYKAIAIGVHSGDHFQYPDCRPGFINTAEQAIYRGNDGFWRGAGIYAPFLYMSKADIAEQAFNLGVPFHQTWSCYKGGENHCGRCGTCVERLEAIDEAQKRMLIRYPHTDTVWADQTVYDDDEFWKVQVAMKKQEGEK